MATKLTATLPCGIWTSLVTPFHEDSSVDFQTFGALALSQLSAGVNALVVGASVGEGSTLHESEKVELVKMCVAKAGATPVIGSAGHNDTRHAVVLHALMKQAGAAAALHVTPYYNKPTQEGLYRHFKAIAESSDLPVVLYNVPSRTGVDLLPATTLRLAKDFKNIVAIKESSMDCGRLQNMISDLALARPDFLVLGGEDSLLLPLLAMGGHGIISTGSNFAPEVFCATFNAMTNGDLKEAKKHFAKIAKLNSLMFMTTNPIPVKTALSFRGLLHNFYRLPLCPLSESDSLWLKAALAEQGWL